MLKYLLSLEGLNCAGCAAKIEDRVNKLSEVEEANLNFTTKVLTVNVKEEENKNLTVKKIKDIVNTLEPEVVVSEYEKNRKTRCIDENKSKNNNELLIFVSGVIIYIIGLIFQFSTVVEFIIFFISYVLVGGEIVLKAFKNILKGEIFDENFLMTVATLGAFCIKEFPEAVSVMIFYKVGELFQDLAVNKSRKSIQGLMDIRPDYANLKIGSIEKKVSPDEVKIGEEIVVKPGEKIPLDGVIVEGITCLDTSALTGESILKDVDKGDSVLAGCINKNGVITIKVTKSFGESTVSKILDLVENANNKKAKTEKFITKFARYYTPIVVVLALCLAIIPPLVLSGENFSDWIYRALVFLVVSCPCALVVSIPLGFFGGIGAASKNGILIKGANYLEALKNVKTIVFDKTGTLTKGIFKVYDVKNLGEFDKDTILKYASYAEIYSNHPIAKSIVECYGKEINKDLIKDYKEIPGRGINAVIEDKHILVGNDKLMKEFNIDYKSVNELGTILHISIEKRYCGYILIGDEIKDDSLEAIKYLKENGVNEIVMLTGDNKKIADNVANRLNIDTVYSELLPHNKVEKLENIFKNSNEKDKIAFVGDGINDAPVLARADIGIAMGGIGSDAAIEAADVVVMTDELLKIPFAMKIAKKTNEIVWQNIIIALSIKVIILILGAFGLADMWEAVFGDVGVALIAILNSMRTLKIKK